MIRPVYAWPRPATPSSLSNGSASQFSSGPVVHLNTVPSAAGVSFGAVHKDQASQQQPLHHHSGGSSSAVHVAESSSKLKRHALMFLSTIRVSEEEALKEAALAQINTRGGHSGSLNQDDEEMMPTILPAPMDSGWGARMRGDIKTQYILASGVQTDKSHRLFLSWDRAYPALVLSLVLPVQQTNAKNKTKSSTLHLPRLGLDGQEECVDGSDDEEQDHGGDSSSEDGNDLNDSSDFERGRRGRPVGKSFAFLLDLPSDFHSNNEQHTPPATAGKGGDRTVSSSDDNHPMLSPSPHRSSSKKRQLPASPQQAYSNTDDRARSRSDSSSSSSSSNSKNNNGDKDNGNNNGGNDDSGRNRLAWDTDYSFEDLDDSRIIQGKHRVVQNLPSCRISIIPYIKTKVLKEELNSVFREQHPDLPRDLTLSMLRKLKREMLERAKFVDCELCTVAMAYVYLEKLVLKHVVHKANRKLVAFTCLIIAFKYNESGMDKFKMLLSEIERVNNVNRTDIFSVEFAVFAHLRFNLNIPGKQYLEHFVRLVRQVDIAPSEYLGETHDEVTSWFKALAVQEKVTDKQMHRRSSSSSTSGGDGDARGNDGTSGGGEKEHRRSSLLRNHGDSEFGEEEAGWRRRRTSSLSSTNGTRRRSERF